MAWMSVWSELREQEGPFRRSLQVCPTKWDVKIGGKLKAGDMPPFGGRGGHTKHAKSHDPSVTASRAPLEPRKLLQLQSSGRPVRKKWSEASIIRYRAVGDVCEKTAGDWQLQLRAPSSTVRRLLRG